MLYMGCVFEAVERISSDEFCLIFLIYALTLAVKMFLRKTAFYKNIHARSHHTRSSVLKHLNAVPTISTNLTMTYVYDQTSEYYDFILVKIYVIFLCLQIDHRLFKSIVYKVIGENLMLPMGCIQPAILGVRTPK